MPPQIEVGLMKTVLCWNKGWIDRPVFAHWAHSDSRRFSA